MVKVSLFFILFETALHELLLLRNTVRLLYYNLDTHQINCGNKQKFLQLIHTCDGWRIRTYIDACTRAPIKLKRRRRACRTFISFGNSADRKQKGEKGRIRLTFDSCYYSALKYLRLMCRRLVFLGALERTLVRTYFVSLASFYSISISNRSGWMVKSIHCIAPMSRATINGFFSAIGIRICFTLAGTCVCVNFPSFAFIVVRVLVSLVCASSSVYVWNAILAVEYEN